MCVCVYALKRAIQLAACSIRILNCKRRSREGKYSLAKIYLQIHIRVLTHMQKTLSWSDELLPSPANSHNFSKIFNATKRLSVHFVARVQHIILKYIHLDMWVCVCEGEWRRVRHFHALPNTDHFERLQSQRSLSAARHTTEAASGAFMRLQLVKTSLCPRSQS